MSSNLETHTGTIEDVASFIGIAVCTVRDWVKVHKLGAYRFGEGKRAQYAFGEEHVVDFMVSKRVEAKGRKPGEAAEIVRREWRNHLDSRRGKTSNTEHQTSNFEVSRKEFEELRQRVLMLEQERTDIAA